MKVYTLPNLSHYQYLSAPHSILTERTTEYFAEEHSMVSCSMSTAGYSAQQDIVVEGAGAGKGSAGHNRGREGGEIEGEDEQRGLEGWYKTTTPMSEGNGKYFYEGLKGTVTAKV